MLVIGHRGAAGSAPENSLQSLRNGVDAGADMLEFDVRMTSDNVPVLMHDSILLRTHRKRDFVKRVSYSKLQELTASSDNPIVSLENVLDEFMGKILLNIEIKQHGMAPALIELLERKYIKNQSDWEVLVFSSFSPGDLVSIRKHNSLANLWLLHKRNPFIFIAYTRRLQLSGVGFHRLYINEFALAIAKKTNLFTYTYTVNRPAAAKLLHHKGLDGIVTDYPSKLINSFTTKET